MATHDPAKLAAHDPLETHAPHLDEHPEQHEHTDVKIKPLAWTFVALCVLGIVGHGGLYWLHVSYQNDQEAENKQEVKSGITDQTRRRTEAALRTPPEGVPKIQGLPKYNAPTPAQEMKGWRDQEGEKLTTAGPGRRSIEEAIRMTVAEGEYKRVQPKERPQTRPAETQPAETQPDPPPFRIPLPKEPADQPPKDTNTAGDELPDLTTDKAPPPPADGAKEENSQ